MELHEPFGLAAVLRAETSAAEDENHGMRSLQFGELAAFRGVVGKLVIGEDRAWNDVSSHRNSLAVGCTPSGYVSSFPRHKARPDLPGRPRARVGYHLPACAPPSTCRISPVANVASVRYKTASTISLTSPILPIGCSPLRDSSVSGLCIGGVMMAAAT